MAAAHFGTSSYYVGTYYDTYAAKDQQQREWKFMSDASIKAQRKEGKTRFDASPEYRTEMVSPICRYEDIVTVQELIRKLREAGAFANKSCGIHYASLRIIKKILKKPPFYQPVLSKSFHNNHSQYLLSQSRSDGLFRYSIGAVSGDFICSLAALSAS